MIKIFLVPFLVTSSIALANNDPKLTKLLDKMNDIWSGKSSKGQMTMEVKKEYYSRSMTMDLWSLGQNYFLTKIVKPKKDKGIASLKRNDDMYNYLPKINKTIRIGKAMLGGSWMGSHITNDDMVRMSRYTSDYDYSEVKDAKLEKGQMLIRLIPHKNSAVVWGRIDMTIDLKKEAPVKNVYFDQNMKAVREFTFDKLQKQDDRYIPMITRVTPLTAEEKGEYTEIRYEKLIFNVDLDESWFSLSQLKR